ANILDTKVDDMFAQFRREIDPMKREKIGHDLQRYVAEQMYWGNLTGSPLPVALQNDVKGYIYRDHFKVQFETVWLDR
ncbi:MAG: hypothetical protein O7G88_18180, partial [bacterium]|nr:hypothetical protein [bacterium]